MTEKPLTGPFPFSAIVGQDEMKLAMILTAIDPGIGGVLVFGDRGTGKSTAVRGLAALLPPIRAVAGCPVNSAAEADVPDWAHVHDHSVVEKPTPVIDLPLGATEDRVVGALDIEKALSHGEKAFEPGLLARANRGYLYIDEVNLLEDHLVDLLLDVAQSARTSWNGRVFRSATPRASCWSGPETPRRGSFARSFWTGSACRSRCRAPGISTCASTSSAVVTPMTATSPPSSPTGTMTTWPCAPGS